MDVKVRNGHGYIPMGAARPAVGGNARKTKTGRDSFCWFSALKLLENGVIGNLRPGFRKVREHTENETFQALSEKPIFVDAPRPQKRPSFHDQRA